MFKTGLIAIFAGATLLSANAQGPGGDVFFGYSYSQADIFSRNALLQPPSRSTNFNGWEGSLQGKFLPFIGIVLDLSQRYGSDDFTLCGPAPQCIPGQRIDSSVFTVMFGPRVSFSVGRLTPFAHALFGAGHVSNSHASSASDTSFATAIGGGVDCQLIKPVAWRFQGDVQHTSFFDHGQNTFRIGTGIVLRF